MKHCPVSFFVSSRLTFVAALGVMALMAGSAFAQSGQTMNMGPEDESKSISVTVWLNPHNKAALDTAVEQMYEKGSANYHQFLTMKQFNEQFAPTAQEAGVVRDFLTSHCRGAFERSREQPARPERRVRGCSIADQIGRAHV